MAVTDIFVGNIQKNKNKVVYEYAYSDNLQDYFNPQEQFFIEYDIDKQNQHNSQSGFSIEDIPDGILIIPFLCNVLPIAWVVNATIHVDEIDKNFYESISEFKKGYYNMYPLINFSGKVMANKTFEYNIPPPPSICSKRRNNLVFFSGGVDAFNTLINHYEEKPILMTLWGSDIFFDDTQGWNNVKEHVYKTAEQLCLEYILIKSNFRKFLNESSLSKLVSKRANDGWWHGFQHGIGIIGHAAPVAYWNNTEIIYIASSYTAKDAGKATCASDPTIDNHVRMGKSKVIHDGYKFNRPDKVKNICDFVNKEQISITLRVCWQLPGGTNCGECEKCYRTIMSILSKGYDPNEYGFVYNEHINIKIKNYLLYTYKMSNIISCLWKDIQSSFARNDTVLDKRPELKWILKINFDTINRNLVKFIYNTTKRIFNFLKRILTI
jgi:hypothetical protein